MQFQKVTHVIFDMDGLLLSTEVLYEKIISKILQKFGHTYSLDLQMKLRGTSDRETVITMIKELNLNIMVEELLKIYKEEQIEGLKNPELMPGAAKLDFNVMLDTGVPLDVASYLEIDYSMRIEADVDMVEALDIETADITSDVEKYEIEGINEAQCIINKLVRHLARHQIPIALATSSFRDLYETKIENHRELFSLFHHLVSASDPEVKYGKPAPDIFLICASKFPDHPDPQKCLVLEDAPAGVKGALAAGMQAVLVPAKDVPQELRVATLVLNSLEEFRPELFGLPSFDV